MYNEVVDYIRELYETDDFIALHEPRFNGNEKKYVAETIDSTFVSSVGRFVDQFEQDFSKYIGVEKSVACVNGTAALHMSLILAGVSQNDEVITQSLTFIATCNAITYQKAYPVFVDVDKDTMGMSPVALRNFLEKNAKLTKEGCLNKSTGRIIKAVVPMHSFGHACRIDEIASICKEWNILLVEDAAEAIGSRYKGKALGTFGDIAAFSFNGNKIITTGGGGMVVAKDQNIAAKAKYLTTTAKKPHPYEFFHDEVGYNYRLPNINAALGCAQLEQIDVFLKSKRQIAQKYKDFFKTREEQFIDEIKDSEGNFWLNAILLKDRPARDEFLNFVNSKNVMVRPVWTLINKLPMFKGCQSDLLENSKWLEDRIVNLPSSARL
ncbi:MAG: LegC family aminotransferase [Emcibacteraceae bacterium]